MTDGYEAMMKLNSERPDLLALVRVIYDLGEEGFHDALNELVRRDILALDPRRVENDR